MLQLKSRQMNMNMGINMLAYGQNLPNQQSQADPSQAKEERLLNH